MTTALETIFARDTPLKILVVGDVMIDGYLEGDVGRTSPEAPVPVVLSKATRQVAGGAANVANNLRALGAEVTLAGLVGDDDEGSPQRFGLEYQINNIAYGELASEQTGSLVSTSGRLRLRLDLDEL